VVNPAPVIALLLKANIQQHKTLDVRIEIRIGKGLFK
jgi:hypothetical protein